MSRRVQGLFTFFATILLLLGVLGCHGTSGSSGGMTGLSVTLSGTLGTAGAGAVLTCAGTTTQTVTADANGNYRIQVPISWSGNVVPAKAGYSFTPALRTYTSQLWSLSGQDYVATPLTYTVSGSLGANGAGATLSWTDGTARTATADASGDYSLIVPYDWSGTVAPSLTGYSFAPASRTYANVRANQDGQDYTTAPLAYTLSGSLGAHGAGATLSWTDGTARTATADGSGAYSIVVSYNWSGTLTPSRTGYSFAPASRTYANVLASQNGQDYTTTPITYTLSGSLGANGAGATLAWTDGTARTATADGTGAYSVTVSYNWSGTLTPSRTGYGFAPISRTYSNVLSSQSGQDFTTSPITYTISGSLGSGGAGATLSWTDGTAKTATADGSGAYSIVVSYDWSGTVTPQRDGYHFTPANRSYSHVLADAASQDYTAAADPNSIVSMDPADSATGVPITKTITITYASNVTLVDGSGIVLKQGSVTIPVTVSASAKDLLIDPVPLLERNTSYTLTIPADAVLGASTATGLTFKTIQIAFTERTGVVVSTVAGASIGRSDMSNNIIVSETGVIHVVWKVPDAMSATPAATDGIYYSRSVDGGATFQPGIRVRDASGLVTGIANQVEPEIACSGGSLVYITYQNAAGQLEVVRSADGGDNWGSPVVIGPGGTLSEQKHIFAQGNAVYLSANDGSAPEAASVDNGGNTFLRSLDGGLSFQPPITGLVGHPLHALLVNPLNQHIYIVGTEVTGVNAPSNIWYVRSTDGGASFEPAVDTGHLITHAGYCFDRSGRIVIIARDGKLVIGDMNTSVWTESSTVGSSSLALQSTMTVDGDSTIYRVGTAASDSRIHITYTRDGGLNFTDVLIDDGSFPNAASSVNMSGVAMVYMRNGVVYFAYRNPNTP